MFVHKISINEESLIVYNYEKDKPQRLLYPYIPWGGFMSTD